MKTISFRENVAASHGEVLRSSAIFYFRNNKTTKSTISILNYWRFKRDIEVTLVASIRDMSGNLLSRRPLTFEKGHVINFSPFRGECFEGSVEIEVFCAQNMAIPYSAIVCCYETEFGFSVVHAYGRVYSSHEVEEGRALTEGTEGCWTIRDSQKDQSFCVVHNGYLPQEEQTIHLSILNSFGEKLETKILWPALKPHETRKLYPSRYFENLTQFLGGSTGQATLDFNLGAGFTRMLIGNERKDGSDLQVTHSNFDYSRQKTDLAEPGMDGYMVIPDVGNSVQKVIVYPQMVLGSYSAYVGSEKIKEFQSGEIVELKNVKSNTLIFKRKDGLFPTRLVTGLEMLNNTERIPGECSLGVLTKLQPRKRFWWGIVTPPSIAECHLVVHDLPEIYQNRPANTVMIFSLYASGKNQIIEKQILLNDLRKWEVGVPIQEVWPEATKHLNGEFGYFTLYCEYGGLTVYSFMKNKFGSVCLEHGF